MRLQSHVELRLESDTLYATALPRRFSVDLVIDVVVVVAANSCTNCDGGGA